MDGHQRQREQSGRMIEEALFALMEEKKFEDITVSEIVKHADVARRTFYRLYGRKEDVLYGYFQRLCEEYQTAYSELQTYNLKQIAEEFFGFWYTYRELLLLLYRCGLDEMLYCEIRRASLDVVGNRIGNKLEKEDSDIEYFACYSTGGFLMLLHRWIMDGMQEPPEEYANKASRALLKFIRPV